MLYAIIGEDVPGSLQQRLAARPAHLERLRTLQDEGRLIVAGPCPASATRPRLRGNGPLVRAVEELPITGSEKRTQPASA